MPDHIFTPQFGKFNPPDGRVICTKRGRYAAIALDEKASGTSVIVTGDKEIQMVGMAAGRKIISPRQFWQELTQG